MKETRGFDQEKERATISKKLIAAFLMFVLVLLPTTGVADSNDTKTAEAYEKVMDKALEEALLLELDTTASLLKGHKGKAVASAMVSLLKAANEIEADNDTAEDETGISAEDTEKKKDSETSSSDSSEKSKISDSMYKRAAKYGAYIRDVDTQLVFCSLLKKEGYEIAKVYPEGVEVDFDLHAYQPALWKDWQSGVGKSNKTLNPSKLLIFQREDVNKPELTWCVTEDSTKWDSDYETMENLRYQNDYKYTVKLRADLMQNEKLADRFAQNTEECTAYIILDKGYWVYSNIGFTQTTRNNSQTTVTHHYGFGYTAFETIAVYSAEDPTASSARYRYINYPIVKDKTYAFNDTDHLTYTFKYTDKDKIEHEETYLADANNLWNVERFMIAQFEENWLDEYIKNKNEKTNKTKLESWISALPPETVEIK